jgi:hypothetical protein
VSEPHRFFQGPKDGEDKKPYSGPENRYFGSDKGDRPVLTEEGRNIVKEIKKVMTTCRDHCVIPEEVQPHIGHMAGTIKDMGKGDFARGINKHAGNHREVEGWSETWKNIKSTAIRIIVMIIIGAIAGILAYGFWGKLADGLKDGM